MNIEIECSPKDATLLFDSPTLTQGMSRDVPGGSIRLVMKEAKRGSISTDAFPLIVVANLTGTVVLGLFINWLYDKLKSYKGTRIRINRKQIVEVTQAEAIIKVITEEEIVEE